MKTGLSTVAGVAFLAVASIGTLTITGNGTNVIRSFQSGDFSATLSTNSMPRVLSYGGSSLTTNSARVYTNYTTATVAYDQQFLVLPSGTYAIGPQPFTVSSSNTNAATITTGGFLRYVTNGTTTVTYVHTSIPPYTVSYPITEAYQGGATQSVFSGWQSGLMPYDMNQEVDLLATNASPGVTLNLFSSYNDNLVNGPLAFTRNTNVWTGVANWTGVLAASNQGGSPYGGGALLTPQDFVGANHAGAFTNGTTCYWADTMNGLHSATVASQVQVAGTDIQLYHLSQSLPSALKYYKLLPVAYSTNVVNYCPDYNLNYWPIVLALDYGHLVYIEDVQPIAINSIVTGYTNELCYNAATEANRVPYTFTVNTGSGSPGFAIINGEPVIVGCLHTTGTFSWLAANVGAIDYALTNTLGSSYTATVWTNSFAATSTNGSVTSFPTY